MKHAYPEINTYITVLSSTKISQPWAGHEIVWKRSKFKLASLNNIYKTLTIARQFVWFWRYFPVCRISILSLYITGKTLLNVTILVSNCFFSSQKTKKVTSKIQSSLSERTWQRLSGRMNAGIILSRLDC